MASIWDNITNFFGGPGVAPQQFPQSSGSTWEGMQYGNTPGYGEGFGSSEELAGAGPLSGNPMSAPATGSYGTPIAMPQQQQPMWARALQGGLEGMAQQQTPYWSHNIRNNFTAPQPGVPYREQQKIDNQRRGQDLVSEQAIARTGLGQQRLDYDIGQAQQKAELRQERLNAYQEAMRGQASPGQQLGVADPKLPGAQELNVGASAPSAPAGPAASPALQEWQRRRDANAQANQQAAQYALRTNDLEGAARMRAAAPHPGKPPETYGPVGPIPGSGGRVGQMTGSGQAKPFSLPPQTTIKLPAQGKLFKTDDGAQMLIDYDPDTGERRLTELSPPTDSLAQARAAGKVLRMQVGEREYEKLLEEAVGRGGSELDMRPEMVATFLEENFPTLAQLVRSDFARQVKAARDSWIEPFLRDDTGAAVPAQERTQTRATYYPSINASKREIAIKRVLRAGANEAVKAGMSPQARAKIDARTLSDMGDFSGQVFTKKRRSRLEELQAKQGRLKGSN